MRVSTNTMYESGASRISELQTALLKTQQQISAKRRLLTPSDDPIAAARALEVTQSLTLNAQYAKNRDYATGALNLEESALQNITGLIQDVQTKIIEAGNLSYNDSERKDIAADLRGRLTELIGYANSRDSEGNYVFSGFQTATQPFKASASGVQYMGDQGQRNLQVAAVRKMSISDSGDAVFQNIQGSGTFSIAVGAGTFGGSAITSPSVTDQSLLTAQMYTLSFSDGGATYTVTDSSSNVIVSGSYVSGEAIEFDGVKLNISGTRADGDMLTISTTPPSGKSIFSSLSDLVALLETPASGAAGRPNLTQGLATANTNFSSALDNILMVRASVGARMKELEVLDSAGDERDVQYAATLSELQDLDYVKAISELSLQKTTLEAAQQSFLKIINLSLFNYL